MPDPSSPRSLRARFRPAPAPDRLALEAATIGTRTAFDDLPGRVVTIAGLHGGAGATTLALTLANAATTGTTPPLVMDLAGPAAGGLAILAGTASTEPPMTLAALRSQAGAVGRLETPIAKTDSGVAIIGTPPRADTMLDHYAAGALSRIGERARNGGTPEQIAELVERVAQTHLAKLLPGGEDTTDQLTALLEQVRQRFGLVVVDLGMAIEPDVSAAALHADLHLWVCSTAPASRARAQHLLATHQHHPGCKQLLVVWDDGTDQQPTRKQFVELSGTRGLPIVQMAHHGPTAQGIAAMVLQMLTGLAAICDAVPRG